ncbi:MAG: hypothetical protein KF810_03020 [Rhizobiaceae bacterium]|nr:hypothetical protein [Rhizobiaceae bacterium]
MSKKSTGTGGRTSGNSRVGSYKPRVTTIVGVGGVQNNYTPTTSEGPKPTPPPSPKKK